MLKGNLSYAKSPDANRQIVRCRWERLPSVQAGGDSFDRLVELK